MSLDNVLKTPYSPVVNRLFAPAWVDHVLQFHGIAPPRERRQPFRYIDLGCGYGVTSLYLAAAYPAAKFIGVDANPTHIAAAKEIALRAELSNITFHCAKFGDSQIEEITPADYVVANGVYTWLPKEIRGQLVDCFHAEDTSV